MIFGLYMKLVFGLNNQTIILVTGGVLSLCLLIVGHFDVKYGIASMESSIGNRYNPELQTLLSRDKKR